MTPPRFGVCGVPFVDEDEIDSRYWEKPYYLIPDGDEADEGYAIMQKALAETRKVAVGQLIMHGRGHLVGIKEWRLSVKHLKSSTSWLR